MQQVSVVVDVLAPAATVWEVLTDLEGTAGVLSGVRAIERLSEDTGYRVGTRWRETRTMFGQQASEVMEVTSVEPVHRTEIRAEAEGMRYVTQFELRPVRSASGPGSDAEGGRDRTQLVMRFRGQAAAASLGTRILAAVTAPLGLAVTRRVMVRDLADIAAEAERRERR